MWLKKQLFFFWGLGGYIKLNMVRSGGVTKARSKALALVLDRHVFKYLGTVWIYNLPVIEMGQGLNGMGWKWGLG